MKRLIMTSALLVWASVATAQDAMRMAVTTSFDTSGLAEVLLPAIAEGLGLGVQLLVVGTGQALKLTPKGLGQWCYAISAGLGAGLNTAAGLDA